MKNTWNFRDKKGRFKACRLSPERLDAFYNDPMTEASGCAGDFVNDWRKREPGWFNAPVASFGAKDARLLIVGLAPGLQGANRTGDTALFGCAAQ